MRCTRSAMQMWDRPSVKYSSKSRDATADELEAVEAVGVGGHQKSLASQTRFSMMYSRRSGVLAPM